MNNLKNKINKLYYFIFLSAAFSQWHVLSHEGNLRSYYVSYPNNIIESSPLIINMHGYGGNAESQQFYSEMDQFAHPHNIAVVYPQGLNNSWNVYTFWDNNEYNDVGFINAMIDEINENFNIDLDRIYVCGMSNGGYMSYRLACDLSDRIAAFGSVTGNFMINNTLNDCNNQDRYIPIIHIHGTADGIVNYYPPSFDGSLTVEESIQFWSNHNNLIFHSSESIAPNVIVYNYSNELNSAKFVHYKVIGGGHDWFGNPWSTNWNFNTSEELINFFLDYRLSDFINNQLIGDVNLDGELNVLDIVIHVSLVLNEEYNQLGDINEDNFINILDIIALVDILLNP